MAVPIYAFVKQKLASHGAYNSPDGRITVENRRVFVRFVRLERAVRLVDFAAVQCAVDDLDSYVSSLGKRHLIAFAYLYMGFSAGSPRKTQETRMEDGGLLRLVEYRSPVTPEERLIADWGTLLAKQVERDFLRVVYASKA